MTRRRATLALAFLTGASLLAAAPASAAGPASESDGYTVRFFDDAIWELCGIETMTTLTEYWTFKSFPDGSAIFHNVRTFVPDDPRIPIEKGHGTSHIAPDGTRRVTGAPLILFYPKGDPRGRVVIAAGQAIFGDNITYHGHDLFNGQHPDDVDMSPYYCP